MLVLAAEVLVSSQGAHSDHSFRVQLKLNIPAIPFPSIAIDNQSDSVLSIGLGAIPFIIYLNTSIFLEPALSYALPDE